MIIFSIMHMIRNGWKGVEVVSVRMVLGHVTTLRKENLVISGFYSTQKIQL